MSDREDRLRSLLDKVRAKRPGERTTRAADALDRIRTASGTTAAAQVQSSPPARFNPRRSGPGSILPARPGSADTGSELCSRAAAVLAAAGATHLAGAREPDALLVSAASGRAPACRSSRAHARLDPLLARPPARRLARPPALRLARPAGASSGAPTGASSSARLPALLLGAPAGASSARQGRLPGRRQARPRWHRSRGAPNRSARRASRLLGSRSCIRPIPPSSRVPKRLGISSS